MKVGILTFHRSHNYGAVLQGYALKKHLESKGVNVEIIDYWPKYRDRNYETPKLVDAFKQRTMRQAIRNLKHTFLTYPHEKLKHTRFKTFIAKNLLTPPTTKIQSKDDIPLKYDLVVIGSDQVWRYHTLAHFNGFDPAYWGAIKSNTIISYAASIGSTNISPSQKKFIENHLPNFNRISVREKSLKSLIETLTSSQVTHVLDPVFLLNSNDWRINLKIIPPRKHREYLLLYNLANSKNSSAFAARLAKHKGLDLIEIRRLSIPSKNPERYCQSAGPKEFIELLSGASFVISNSFHGVAFSLVFEKQFIATEMGNRAERVTDLLDTLDLADCYKPDCDQINVNDIVTIDYSVVLKKINRHRKESLSYLHNCISST